MRKAIVSVIITINDESTYIERAIDSVYSQTFQDYEVIVVDDSTANENFSLIAERYGERENLIYIRNDYVIGKSASMNAGVMAANGTYVAFLDGNAQWVPEKLEKQMAVICSEVQGTDFVYSAMRQNQDSAEVWPPEEWVMQRKCGNIFPTLLLTPLADISTILMKKDLYFAVGGLNEQLEEGADQEFTLRVARRTVFLFVEEVLTIVNKKESNGTPEAQIAVQCYLMLVYARELELYGLKKIKFHNVLEEAMKYNNKEFYFKQLLELSNGKDSDYIAYVREELQALLSHVPKENIDTKNVSGVRKCTGCLSCYNICPYGAIEDEEDEDGFIRPVINGEKCQNCGLCVKVCPMCNECEGTLLSEKCYAVIADDETRKHSSSGGVFGKLALEVLQRGGYVAGAVYDKDFRVRHILSNRYEDLVRMQSSKYVQSNTEKVYGEVKEKLEENKPVLFSGCACQIAGLKLYLGKEYENLLLVDVVCHGVPSPKVFRQYIDSVSGGTENIQEISFRKKEKMGWSTGFYLKLKNGEELLEMDENAYIRGFLGNWFLQESCYDCRFKNKQYSDITLGDFWGIGQWSDFDDGKGTSLMLVNTQKGEAALNKMAEHFKRISLTKTHNALIFNPSINQAAEKSRCKEVFFAELKSQKVQSALEAVFDKFRYDVCLVYWWSQNYGNALTNYALYQAVKKLNKTVMVIDNLGPMKPVKQFQEFAKKHYECSSELFPNNHVEILNMCCDTFVVGSDQVWNREYAEAYHCGNFFQLDFVNEGKRKISYASSFGSLDRVLPAEIGGELYRQFDAISVREAFGVHVCREEYQVEAELVVDPVFLLGMEEYGRLAEESEIVENEPYILTYLLNPTEGKRELITEIQRKLGMKVINIIDASPVGREDNMAILNYENIKWGLSVEDFIYYLKNSSYVITDSFHGTCFSVIFNKNFVAVQNRQAERFAIFQQFAGLQSHIIGVGEMADVNVVLDSIEYEPINQVIKEKSKRSLQWLEQWIG